MFGWSGKSLVSCASVCFLCPTFRPDVLVVGVGQKKSIEYMSKYLEASALGLQLRAAGQAKIGETFDQASRVSSLRKSWRTYCSLLGNDSVSWDGQWGVKVEDSAQLASFLAETIDAVQNAWAKQIRALAKEVEGMCIPLQMLASSSMLNTPEEQKILFENPRRADLQAAQGPRAELSTVLERVKGGQKDGMSLHQSLRDAWRDGFNTKKHAKLNIGLDYALDQLLHKRAKTWKGVSEQIDHIETTLVRKGVVVPAYLSDFMTNVKASAEKEMGAQPSVPENA